MLNKEFLTDFPFAGNGNFNFPLSAGILDSSANIQSFLLPSEKYGELKLPKWWFTKIFTVDGIIDAPTTNQCPWKFNHQNGFFYRDYSFASPSGKADVLEELILLPDKPSFGVIRVWLRNVVGFKHLQVHTGISFGEEKEALDSPQLKLKPKSMRAYWKVLDSKQELAMGSRFRVFQDYGLLEFPTQKVIKSDWCGHQFELFLDNINETLIERVVVFADNSDFLIAQFKKAVKSKAKAVFNLGIHDHIENKLERYSQSNFNLASPIAQFNTRIKRQFAIQEQFFPHDYVGHFAAASKLANDAPLSWMADALFFKTSRPRTDYIAYLKSLLIWMQSKEAPLSFDKHFGLLWLLQQDNDLRSAFDLVEHFITPYLYFVIQLEFANQDCKILTASLLMKYNIGRHHSELWDWVDDVKGSLPEVESTLWDLTKIEYPEWTDIYWIKYNIKAKAFAKANQLFNKCLLDNQIPINALWHIFVLDLLGLRRTAKNEISIDPHLINDTLPIDLTLNFAERRIQLKIEEHTLKVGLLSGDPFTFVYGMNSASIKGKEFYKFASQKLINHEF